MRCCFLFCMMFFHFVLVAQTDSLPSDKDLAHQYITQLKSGGALIVRLKARDKNIAAYRNSGNIKVAEEMEEADRKTNRVMMDAFRTQFRFCPVYFMYARHSRDFVSGKRNVLVNEGLREDTSILFNHDFFLFVDFGTSMINESKNAYTQTRQTQEGSTPGNSEAYVVLDTAFRQLHSPFPYHTMLNFLETNAHQKAVARLNRKMFEFFVSDKQKLDAQELKEAKKKSKQKNKK